MRATSDHLSANPFQRATDLCYAAWGIVGNLTPLGSERDQVFRVDAQNGERFVLRLTNPDEPALVTAFHTAALLHVAKRDSSLPVPHLIPDREGRVAFRPDWPGPLAPTARLLTWLNGLPVAEAPRSEAQSAGLGVALARLQLALADFDHPGADHYLHWDLRHTADLRPRLSVIEDKAKRRLVERAIDRFEASTSTALAALRKQVVHADLTPHNALVAKADPGRVVGIIDFGDLIRTALVCDPAIAASYLMGDEADMMRMPHALVAAFHAVQPLTVDEIRLLPALMQARHAMTVAITESHAIEAPADRDTITKNTATAWRGLEVLAEHSENQLADGFLAACNMGSPHE